MKKFPPLHPLTANALPPRPADDMPAYYLAVRTLCNAEIHIGLGTLILETFSESSNNGSALLVSSIEGNQSGTFGKVATIALLSGDTSFFEQVRFCISALGDKQGVNDLQWAVAYLKARLTGDGDIPPSPIASAVADAKNNHDKKTAIPAVAARDACRKLDLPLAPGARGKKRGGKSGKRVK